MHFKGSLFNFLKSLMTSKPSCMGQNIKLMQVLFQWMQISRTEESRNKCTWKQGVCWFYRFNAGFTSLISPLVPKVCKWGFVRMMMI